MYCTSCIFRVEKLLHYVNIVIKTRLCKPAGPALEIYNNMYKRTQRCCVCD